MRRFNSHKTVVVCVLLAPACVKPVSLLPDRPAVYTQVMPASIQGYERNYKHLGLSAPRDTGSCTFSAWETNRYYSSTRVAQAEESLCSQPPPKQDKRLAGSSLQAFVSQEP